MPMFQTVAGFLAAALLAFLARAASRPRLCSDLRKPRFWLALAGLASLASAVSALAGQTGHAGTGLVTRHGWPKAYWFEFRSELGERSTGFELLYFAGNSLAWGAALLLAWTVWRFVRAGGGSAPPGT